MRFLQRWARGKQWRIPFLALIGVIAVIGPLLLYKPAFVDKGAVGLVVVDLALFFGGGFLATWATIAGSRNGKRCIDAELATERAPRLRRNLPTRFGPKLAATGRRPGPTRGSAPIYAGTPPGRQRQA